MEKDIVNYYVDEHKSICEISKIINISRFKIRKVLVKHNIEIDSKLKATNPRIILTSEQEEILFGGLLGDACLTKNGKEHINANISYCSSKIDHVEWFKNFFDSDKNIEHRTILDKRTEKKYEQYQYRSQLNITYSEYRDKWYVGNTKIIPKNLILTPLMCLIWYIGDGSINQIYKEERTNGIKLSTNSFTTDEINKILIPQLQDYNAKIYYNDKKPIIIIPRKKVEQFLSYIGECPIKSYEYKWFVYPYKYKKI